MKKSRSKNRLVLAFVLNLVFTIFEIIGGILTNSVALLSDSIHDLGDSLSIGLSMILESKSKKKPDLVYTYGYRRYSLLGGLISSLVLIIGSTIVIFEAIPRIFHPEVIDVKLVLWFAIIGVIVNGIAAINTSKGHSINEKIISLHLFEDVLGWLALLIAAIVMYFWPVYIIDSILSVLFTLYILTHVFKNFKEIIGIFLEKAPIEPSISKIKATIIDGVIIKDIHHIHYWSLEGNIPLLTFHAVFSKNTSIDVMKETQKLMHQKLSSLGIYHATIEIESEEEDCFSTDCEEIEKEITTDHHHHH